MMAAMALRDYASWHDDYDRPGSALHLRLLVVQDLIASALDELPPGPVRVISMCAGQGRDVIGAARRHRRGRDLTGVLVESDARNVAVARKSIEQAGLDDLTVIEGDAGHSGVYAGAVPADLVLACGIFGNVSDADIRRTVSFLPALCAAGAWMLWTRAPRDDGILAAIQDWSAAAGFTPRALVVGEGDLFGVGAAVLTGPPSPFPPDQPLFTFVQ
jgi:Putative methyltransferase